MSESSTGIRFNLDDVFADGRARRTDLAKARIFLAILERNGAHFHTRRTLTESLSLRQATVSAMVGELIQDGLIVETEKATPVGKGRPETSLGVQANRIMMPVMQVVSREIIGVLLNLEGRIVSQSEVEIDEDQAKSENLDAAFQKIAGELLAQRPVGTDITGIGISLPGIVDERGLHWISAARWPNLLGIDFHRLADKTGLEVRIERNRQAELRARLLRHPEEREGGILYVSWGYGISSAYAQNGTVLASTMGGFGDLGHWLVEPESRRKCLCGQFGCLEAHAALWALMPEIRNAFPETTSDPKAIMSLFETRDVSHIPRIEHATRLFALSLHNLFKAFFPDRIVLSGYFTQNPWIAQRVRRLFFSHMPAYALGRVALEFTDSKTYDAAIGVATPFFHEALRPLLTARDARI